jgi:hypothetical protein
MNTRILMLFSFAVAALGGCTISGGSPETAAVSATVPLSADMTGRWVLSSSAGGVCAMNFANTGPNEGTIRPEGGCPGKFFTSRKWTYEGNALVIRNHNSEPLGQLASMAPGRFEGQMAGGATPISLVR